MYLVLGIMEMQCYWIILFMVSLATQRLCIVLFCTYIPQKTSKHIRNFSSILRNSLVKGKVKSEDCLDIHYAQLYWNATKILHIDIEWNASGLAKRAQMLSRKLNEFFYWLALCCGICPPQESQELRGRISQLVLGQGMETKDSDRPQR